jgi:hypothetical protein
MEVHMAQLSLKKSATPLKCVLAVNPTKFVRILAASATAQPPTAKNLTTTLAADGQSFTVPLDTVGSWAVVAVANMIPAPPPPELQTGNDEINSDGTVEQAGSWIDFFDDPATLSTVFTLEVTA